MHTVYTSLKINNKFSTHELWNMYVTIAWSKGND